MQAVPPPFRLLSFESLDSTNDEIARRAAQGAPPYLVVTAATQTAGRGRRGRSWVSSPGNLFCSFLLEGRARADEGPQLAFVAAVALQDALSALLPAAAFRCKWPNDLLCQGRKISGMLLESARPHIILGVGVNVTEAPSPALYPTTCLRALGSGATAVEVLAGLCETLAHWHGLWLAQGFAPIRQAWLDRATGVGGPVTVRLADGAERQGRFAGLDEGGALLLEEAAGVTPILAGDVFFPN